MIRGLLTKSLRETWVVLAILAAALVFVEVIFASVLPTIVADLPVQLLQMPFLQTIFRALLGTDLGDTIIPEAITAIAWVHPVVLAIVWTYTIVFCTRMPAGEIDRGTIDVLLGLPVSRWQVYAVEAAALLVTAAVLIAVGLLGHRVGSSLTDQGGPPPIGRLLVVAGNLYCLMVAVGGLACLVSAASSHRGRAVATVFGILLASFLLNFLAQFWAPAEAMSFLSLLDYYAPLPVLQGTARWPAGDMAVLVGFGATAWTAGGLWLARRDICTV